MKPFAFAALIAIAAAAPLPSMAHDNVSLYIGTAPPAPLYERVPAPRRGHVWAPGHWAWNGHRHVWAPGYWVAERPGYVYRAPAWHRGKGGWYLQSAAWTPYGRDHDRDGVPDRYERHGRRRDQDRDGVPNRYDRDRDGDGVPNRRDHRPDNPYRR
jgi:hypothetical protein